MSEASTAVDVITEAVLRKALDGDLGVTSTSTSTSEWDIEELTFELDQTLEGGYISELVGVNVRAEVKAKVKVNSEKVTEETEEKEKVKLVTAEYAVKIVPVDPTRRGFVNGSSQFQVESDVYSEVLPRLQSLHAHASAAGGGNYHAFPFASSPYASAKDGVIIMENLKKNGFKTTHWSSGMDLPHCQLALSALAWFHATSYHLLQSHPGGEEEFLRPIPSLRKEFLYQGFSPECMEILFNAFNNSFVTMVKLLREQLWKGDRGMERRLDVLEETAKERYFRLQRDNKSLFKFRCLLHGDFWNNNIMFKYTDPDTPSLPQEVKLVDLANVWCSSPVFDLGYFLLSTTLPDFRRKHQQQLLAHYQRELSTLLVSYGYDPQLYSLEQLERELRETYFVHYFTSQICVFAKFVPSWSTSFGDPDGDREAFEDLMRRQREVQFQTLLGNPDLRQRLTDMAAEAMEMGVF